MKCSIYTLALLLGCLDVFDVCMARETAEDAARIARTLVSSTWAVGVMATIFPNTSSLAGEPFALQEYFANCYSNGSLSLISMPISRHTQNIMHSPTRSATITVSSMPPEASLPRVAFMGTVTLIETQQAEESGIKACYLAKHPDAKWWLPDDPNAAHKGYWARFDPHSIFFVGGFGSQHYIGDIPLDVYQAARPWIQNDSFKPIAGRLRVQEF